MKRDYSSIKDFCVHQSELSKAAIDEFLMYFIAAKAGLDKTIKKAERKYAHLIYDMPDAYFSTISAQFVVGKALAKGGYFSQYRNDAALNTLGEAEREFLNFQLEHPWRYTFARITSFPAEDFYILTDEISGDDLLVYSPGISREVEDGNGASLYLLLLWYNGKCWQTFGLISAFRSFDIEDFYIFGTEVSVSVEDDESFMKSVYDDPFPYFMLFTTKEVPLIKNGEHVMRHHVGEYSVQNFDAEQFNEEFTVEWNKGVYRVTSGAWSNHPHFGAVYYAERRRLLYLHALTAEGYDRMSKSLIDLGLPVEPDADYTVGLAMAHVMSLVLGRAITFNPFEKWFPETVSPNQNSESSPGSEGVQRFMTLLLPVFNAAKEPDLVAMAAESGIELETAMSIYTTLLEKYRK